MYRFHESYITFNSNLFPSLRAFNISSPNIVSEPVQVINSGASLRRTPASGRYWGMAFFPLSFGKLERSVSLTRVLRMKWVMPQGDPPPNWPILVSSNMFWFVLRRVSASVYMSSHSWSVKSVLRSIVGCSRGVAAVQWVAIPPTPYVAEAPGRFS